MYAQEGGGGQWPKVNLLITTLGTSWQIVPELLGITNPAQFGFFEGSAEAEDLRKTNGIEPASECWIVTTEGQRDRELLCRWAERWGFALRIFVCKGVNAFLDQEELLKMRSLIYRAVFNGREAAKDGKLYLSLSGGRKTMSADMQEAGNLFGCDVMLHVVDKKGTPAEMKEDSLLDAPRGKYAKDFTPLVVLKSLKPSLVVSAGEARLSVKDFPLFAHSNAGSACPVALFEVEEDCNLARKIEKRKQLSSQLYANFYAAISREGGEQEAGGSGLFRELYFLHPDTLRKIKACAIGKNPEKDIELVKSLPKAELHSHLGGVLSPEEIIEVAEEEAGYVAQEGCAASVEFKARIGKILQYKDKPFELTQAIYGQHTSGENFCGIGIEEYQRLGDMQGSGLLQTKKTIAKALTLYAQKLRVDGVKYLELRCSPHNYTQLGLSFEEVVACITRTLDGFAGRDFDYRLICIINRKESKEKISAKVKEIMALRRKNADFAARLAGIDLAGNEGDGKAADFRECFMPFLQNCIHVTIHAGETEAVDSVWEAVYHLNAERVGHGLNLLENESLLRHFADRKIGIEMCPSSNDQVVGFSNGARPYPLKEYLRRGLKVSVNTDNCGISRTSLSGEFVKAAQLCGGLSLWECIVLIRNSLTSAFCDSTAKTNLMFRFEDEILQNLIARFEA